MNTLLGAGLGIGGHSSQTFTGIGNSLVVAQGSSGIGIESGDIVTQPWPDCTGASGSGKIVLGVNFRAALYDISPQRLSIARTRDFLGLGGDTFDPRVIFDGTAFWHASALGSAFQDLVVARSKTSDPSSLTSTDWDVVVIPLTTTAIDFPQVTSDGVGGIVVTLNNPSPATDNYITVASDLSYVKATIPNDYLYTPAGSWLVALTSDTNLRFIKDSITYDIPISSKRGSTSLVQPGGSLTATEPGLCVSLGNSQITVAYSTGGSVAWFILSDATPPVVLQQGTIETLACYLGSIAINARGDIGLTYISSGASDYPAMWVTGRGVNDPDNLLRPSVLAKQSTVNWQNSRVGDYSSMSVDSNGHFWAYNLYPATANAGNNGNWHQFLQFFKINPSLSMNMLLGAGVGVIANSDVTATGTPTLVALTSSGTGALGTNGTSTLTVSAVTMSGTGTITDPGPAQERFRFTDLPLSAPSVYDQPFTLQALDADGNVDTSYTGVVALNYNVVSGLATVEFFLNTNGVSSYEFVPGDNGSKEGFELVIDNPAVVDIEADDGVLEPGTEQVESTPP